MTSKIYTIVFEQGRNKVKTFKYVTLDNLLQELSKHEVLEINQYDEKKEAILSEMLNLAKAIKSFYVVRSNFNNGIFLDKRDAIRYKNKFKTQSAVVTKVENEKSAYNLLGKRVINVDKIKEANEVSQIKCLTGKQITKKGLEMFKQVLEVTNMTAVEFETELAKSYVPNNIKTQLITTLVQPILAPKQLIKKSVELKNIEISPVINFTGKDTSKHALMPVETTSTREQELMHTDITKENNLSVDKIQNKKQRSNNNTATLTTPKKKKKFFMEAISSKTNINSAIEIYCDGSFNEEKGGFYGFLIYDKTQDTIITKKTGYIFDGIFGNSSTGAENMSIMQAVEWAYANEYKEIEIFYDSYDNVYPFILERQLNAVQKRYKSFIDKFLEVMDIKFIHVEKDDSIHHNRHNQVNNLLYDKRFGGI